MQGHTTLPDELLGRYLGLEEFGIEDLGPQDAITQGVSDLTDAFSVSRLMGLTAPVPASLATIGQYFVSMIPQTTGLGCNDLGIVTMDRQLGITNTIPADFNPRPGTNPSPTN